MATLGTSDMDALWSRYMERISSEREACAVTKSELRAAAVAIDQYLSDNAAAINSAIPLPARTSLTTAQKARLLQFVVERRYLAGA